VYLKIEPLPRGTGFEFVDEVKGGTIPRQFLPAVEKGVRLVLEHGAVAGYMLQDVRVIVYDGSYHAVDSKEIAFVTAAKKAFLDAITKARPTVLEPIVNLDVVVPDQYMGDVTGGLADEAIEHQRHRLDARRRARDQGPGAAGRDQRLPDRAQVDHPGPRPLQHGVQPLRAVPGQVQKQLVDAYKPKHEEE
jgi:elongation factor G